MLSLEAVAAANTPNLPLLGGILAIVTVSNIFIVFKLIVPAYRAGKFLSKGVDISRADQPVKFMAFVMLGMIGPFIPALIFLIIYLTG